MPKKNKWFARICRVGTCAVVAGTLGMVNAQAAFDTNVTSMADDALEFFTGKIQPLKIAVVGFFIVLSFVAMVKGRR